MIAETKKLRPLPNWVTAAVNGSIRLALRVLCRLDLDQVEKIPMQGPLIVVTNHVNFLDAPIAFSHLYPRPLTALVKAETWRSPLLGPLFTMWDCIPIRRGEADLDAFQSALDALNSNKMLVIAPEGTRSGHGQLQRGHAGLTMLAIRSGVPILPAAFHGSEGIWDNLKHLRRTPCRLEVGQPFTLVNHGRPLSRDVRQQMVDEVMYQIAALLPERYRGEYADSSRASTEYLKF